MHVSKGLPTKESFVKMEKISALIEPPIAVKRFKGVNIRKTFCTKLTHKTF